MRVAPLVFSGLETASKNGMNADGIKIIRGHDAAGEDLGAVPDAERAARDFGYDEGIDQRAAVAQIHQVGPGDGGPSGLSGFGPPKGHQPFLVRDHRVRTEQYPLDPTEHRGIGADSEREAKDGQGGKSGAAAEHAETEAQILQSRLDHGQSSLFAIVLLGLLHATEVQKRLPSGLLGFKALAEVALDGHFQVRTQLLVKVHIEAAPAK